MMQSSLTLNFIMSKFSTIVAAITKEKLAKSLFQAIFPLPKIIGAINSQLVWSLIMKWIRNKNDCWCGLYY